jgi:hypothetical protein
VTVDVTPSTRIPGQTYYRKDGSAYVWRPSNPPFEAGNTVAVKHGAQAAAIPDDEIADAMRELFGSTDETGLAPAKRATRRLAGELFVRRARALAWVDQHGLIDAEGKPAGILRRLDTWESKLFALLREEGGTTLSELEIIRRRLELRDHAFNASALATLAADGRAALEARRPELEAAGVLDAIDVDAEPETEDDSPMERT